MAKKKAAAEEEKKREELAAIQAKIPSYAAPPMSAYSMPYGFPGANLYYAAMAQNPYRYPGVYPYGSAAMAGVPGMQPLYPGAPMAALPIQPAIPTPLQQPA